MAQRVHKPHNFRALSKPKHIHKSDHRHYWPYIPVLLIVISIFLVSLVQPVHNRGVLAYATSLGNSALLDATNTQRTNNSIGGLQLNGALSSAAQAKANDMIARNYWSHNTPDGQEPWVFVANTGYKYLKAGENLAYGFATSGDTITGWMNSQTHRDNMLDSAFTEVGFGFANGESYNNSGQQTVVVAMYGKPQVLAANSPAPVAPPASAPVAAVPSQAPAPQAPAPAATEPAPADSAQQSIPQPVTTDSPIVTEPASQPIARVQTLTNGRAPWALLGIGLLTSIALLALLIKHAAGLRHILRDGEKFILHHPLLDTLLVSLVLVGTFLSQTSGFIK